MTRKVSPLARAAAAKKMAGAQDGTDISDWLGLLGTAAGAYFGGPQGAALGSTLGSAVGNAFDGDVSGAAKDTSNKLQDKKKMEIIQRLLAGTK